MGRNKKYSGYTAYQYLDPGKDYREFKLRKAVIDEWWEPVPLSKTEEERFEEIMEKNIVIDLHAHADLAPEDLSQGEYYDREGRRFLAHEALAMSGLDCVFDNMMDGGNNIYTKHGWDWNGTIHDLGMKLADIAHQDFVIHCKRVEDITKAHEEGKIAWVGVLESASSIENEVDRLDIIHGLGVRSIGVNYSESNMLGSGLKERGDGGLTDFGYDAVVRMNKLGILIDVSHTSDKTALDTIELSGKPIIVSHSGVRTLTPTTRMFPDDVSYMEHIEYCIDLIGIDYVGCGPDTMYSDHVGLYLHSLTSHPKEGRGHYTRPGTGGENRFLGIDMSLDQLKELKYVRGMENPTECLQNVARWMVKHGYSDAEIAKIIGGNAMRLLKEVW
jgi:membrane dipeptidase